MKTQIKIAIDGREANTQSRVGSNVYAFEIIKSLYKITEKMDEVDITILLSNQKMNDMPEERNNWKYLSFGPEKFWTQWALPIHLFKFKNNYDVFFTPGHYAPRISSIPYVSSVMDTAYIDHPTQFKKTDAIKLTKWTNYSVKNAKKVIAISNYTKQEVIKNYKKNSEDIVVAYPGNDLDKLKIKSYESYEFLKQNKISLPYILFVGTIQPRKNIIKLIEAFEIFNRMKAGRALKKLNLKNANISVQNDQKKVKLILAGKIGWLSEKIIKRINDSPLKSRIILTGFVSQKEKQILYKNALASCLVGTHEGFGIPPLESLNFGVPPIVSNTTSLPEVVGDAGFMADPHNSQDIANKIWEVFSLSSREKGLFRKVAREQIKKFSWEDSATKILNTLIEIAQPKNKNA